MAAYAALTSLLQILDQLEHHPSPPISLEREQVESLTEIATYLQKFLEGYDSPFVNSDEADPLEMRIADAAYEAEDVIESYIVNNIHFAAAATHGDEVNCSSGDQLNPEEINSDEDASSGLAGKAITISGEEISCVNLYEDVWKVIEKMDLVKKETMEKTAVQGHHQLQRNIQSSAAATHNDEVISSRGSASAHILTRIWSCFFNCFQGYSPSDETNVPVMMRGKNAVKAHHQLQRNILRSSSFSGKNSSVMVGFDDVLLQLLDKLTGGPSTLQVIPITGMGGIGKTTLVRNIFQHALVKEYFDFCAWVTISQQYPTKGILSQILYQESKQSSEKTEEELGVELHKYLFGRRYLIIMDDIWSTEVWEKMSFFFVDCNNGSRIIVTTRQSFLISQYTNDVFHMKFLNEVNSWNLFSKTVFGEEGFPLQLKKIGKRIVEKCKGLPLLIVVIGGLLAKSHHTHEYWENIEQNFNSIVNLENDEFCLKVLKLSYHHLPVYLKPSFLYMGIFEEDERIRVSRLIKLWVSEGFLKPENGKSLETIGEGFLKDLIDRNLILVDELGSTGNIKYCKMHDLLRDLCMKEAENERFYHVIGQHSRRGIQNHKGRRMVFDRSTSKWSHVRSFIDRSVYHGVGLLPNFRLLRILEADESLRLQLEDVIYTSSIAPVEIWKMSQLRHVDLERPGYIYLPDPPSGNSIVILENLQTLKGILNFKCGEEMVKRIPNIKKLRIAYEEIGRDDGDDYCLYNLHSLHKLESLTMYFYVKDDDFLHNITFPWSLIKLSLQLAENTGVRCEEMLEKIGGSLPLLQKLKLRHGVFKTGKWETVEGQFPSLKFLELFYCRGLKQWMIEESSHFPCLEHLHLSLLQELEEIPLEIGEIPTLKSIELDRCSESVVKSALKIVEEQEELQGGEEHLPFLVRVQVSRKKKEALESLECRNFQFNWY